MSERPNHIVAGGMFVVACVLVTLVLYLVLRAPSEASARQAAANFAPADEEYELDTGPTYGVHSNVTGASFVNLDDLPQVMPLRMDPDDVCALQFIEPTTAGGRNAARRGWRILQEERVENLNAVLIVRGLEFAGSGRCRTKDANIALFYQQRLVGVLYGKGGRAIEIARMEPLGKKLRVWSQLPALQGELSVEANAVSFDRVTGSDAVCEGRYRVPAVFNQDYSVARGILSSSGWRPIPGRASDEFDVNPNVRKRFPELGDCAGSGYGECEFFLASPDGRARLRIITLGDSDDPPVSLYDMQCG